MAKDEMKSNGGAAVAAIPSNGDRLTVPEGDVLVRYVGGPAEGIAPHVGFVKHGRIYTVDLTVAGLIINVKKPQFDLVYPADRSRIEAASTAAQPQK